MGRVRGDKVAGRFVALPLSVIHDKQFKKLGGNAVKLLIAIYSQYNGRNNGDFTAAWTVMHEQHGFSSRGTLARALHELLSAQLIIRTREGYFMNPGGRCALYAVTWLPIHDCPGKHLDHPATLKPVQTFRGNVSRHKARSENGTRLDTRTGPKKRPIDTKSGQSNQPIDIRNGPIAVSALSQNRTSTNLPSGKEDTCNLIYSDSLAEICQDLQNGSQRHLVQPHIKRAAFATPQQEAHDG